ncbi:MAG: RluA family pseudouridine synthase [Spirochaetales bacterium]|nr:RluA family pseudouridine synthase [Spirochaetales bacterium]
MIGKDKILYEDNHLLAVNKEPGEIVQGDKTGDTPLLDILKEFIRVRDMKPGNVFLGLPHRLDRPASGVVLFAKTSKGLSRLNEMFRTNQVKKIYWAVVQEKPDKDADKLVHYLSRNQDKNKSFVKAQPEKNAQKAVLSYRVLASSQRYHLLEVTLETGRHHQIRAQLSHIGSPIKGDLKYGYARSNKNGGIHLHARKIELMHPVKKTRIVITAPLPEDPVWDLFKRSLD